MDEKKQSNGGQNRQSRPRSGNGGNNNRNRSRNRNRNRNNSGGRGGSSSNSNYKGNNRNRNGGGRSNGGGRRGPAKPPERTLGQKILAVLTFGLLGKPTQNKRPTSKKPTSQQNAKPAQSAPKSKPNTRKVVLHEVTSSRLYVGNLDYAAEEDEIEELFNGVGKVLSAEVVINPRTQQSKGFAFVEMTNIEEAKRAVDVLHDQDFMGRRLLVSGAKSDGPRDGEESNESDSQAA